MFFQLFLFAAIVAIGLGQSTTQSPLAKSICENLKPKDSPDFAKGSGTYSLKLKLMEKDKFVWIEIKGENKTTFEGFAVQAYDESGKTVIGKFKPDPRYKLISCNNKPNSLAHEEDMKPKTMIHLKWDIPADFPKGKKAVFKAAVTKNAKERFMLTQTIAIAI